MGCGRRVNIVPKKAFLALIGGMARRRYVGEPVARSVGAGPLSHGGNVQAVELGSGRTG
jgi:hypothetical protein